MLRTIMSLPQLLLQVLSRPLQPQIGGWRRPPAPPRHRHRCAVRVGHEQPAPHLWGGMAALSGHVGARICRGARDGTRGSAPAENRV